MGEREESWRVSGEEMKIQPGGRRAASGLLGLNFSLEPRKGGGETSSPGAWAQISASETGWRISAEPGFKHL